MARGTGVAGRAGEDPGSRRCGLTDRLAICSGRVYDLHIAETARCNGAKVVVTDNRRHFSSLLRYDIRVLSTVEFVAELRPGA